MKHLIPFLLLLLVVSCSKEEPTPPPPTKYTVSISLNPTDGGTVSPSGGQFDEGSTISFTVTPSENYIFKNWSGSDTSSNNPLSLTINTNKTLTVNFERKDTDGDGVTDDVDTCPDTPSGEEVNETGCSSSQVDTDDDGVTDDVDTCPDTPEGETVDENGCSNSQKDTDGDGVTDDIDQCPDTPSGEEVNETGCSSSQVDTDGDGVSDDVDQCPDTPEGYTVDDDGCGVDFDGPTVSEIVVTPNEVDVTNGEVEITGRVTVSDQTGVDLNSLPQVIVWEQTDTGGTMRTGSWTIVSGDKFEVILESKFTFNQNSKPGNWSFLSSGFTDLNGYRSTQGSHTSPFTVINN